MTDFSTISPNVFPHHSSLQGVEALACITCNPGAGTTSHLGGSRWEPNIVSDECESLISEIIFRSNPLILGKT